MSYDKSDIYGVIINGKHHFMRLYQKIILDGKYFVFLGKREGEVENVNCIYINSDDKLIVKRVEYRSVPDKDMIANRMKESEYDESQDSGELLKLEMHPEDDELMVLMKNALMLKGATVDKFKRLYGEDRKTDMNNDKSRLEKRHTLSWNKFVSILKLFDIEYELLLKEKDKDNNPGR